MEPIGTPRESLVAALRRHRPADPAEAADTTAIIGFCERHDDPFDRRIAEGHLTASALVLAADARSLLLVHHRKLQRWLQPGGHAEPGEHEAVQVASREAREETGIPDLRLHPTAPRPLDVDVHRIPARRDEPAHLHLDLRYLFLAPTDARPVRQVEESGDLRWFAWEDLGALGLDPGLLRAITKVRSIVGAGGPGAKAPSVLA